MVNDAVRGFVRSGFGDETWAEICSRADCPDSYAPLESYDDDVTFRLVHAATEVLGLSADDVLRVFGHYWITNVATANYSDLMHKTGRTFEDFVKNLDHMHHRIQSTFVNYKPPSFRVVELTAGQLQVDYYSQREGLLPFVIGLFEGLGKHFAVELEVETVPDDAHPMPCKRLTVNYRVSEGADERS